MSRNEYVYRVVIDKYPPNAGPGEWVESKYMPDGRWEKSTAERREAAPEGSMRWAEASQWAPRWPWRHRYLTHSAAHRALSRVLSYGAEAHVERSQAIEWTEPYPRYTWADGGWKAVDTDDD